MGLRAAGGASRKVTRRRGVLFSLWQLRRELQGREVLWYVGNTVVWCSLVKGMSEEVYISRIVEAVHIFMYRLNVGTGSSR